MIFSLGPARCRRGAAVLAAILLLAPAARAAGPEASMPSTIPNTTMPAAQRQAIEGVVHDYLLNHPDVLIQALQAAEDKMKSDAHAKVATVLRDRRRDIYDDPTSPVGGNPHGDVSLVEFFDYRCPYCKEVQPAIEALEHQDRQLRVVYKEMPVLGPASVTAARAALAAVKQGKYQAFHVAMMGTKGQISDATVYQVANSVGLDLARLKRDMAAPAIDQVISANLALATALDIRGTPGFIVDNEVIPGAVDIASLKQLIADARKK